MNKRFPLLIGLITGILMLGIEVAVYYSKMADPSVLQYLQFAIYAAGIIWCLIRYSRSSRYTGQFSELFGQGFRCFIIVTLIMVAFRGIFSLTHPEMAEEQSKYYREQLKAETSKTPAEKEAMIQSAKDHFATGNMYLAVFGYMIMGTVFTLAGATFIVIRKK